MAILYDGPRTANFLIWDQAYVSREEGVIDTATPVLPGSLVEKQATQGTAVGNPATQNVGDGTIGAATVAATAKTGAYTATFTSATAFAVTDPNGTAVATGTAGTAFSNQIGFTITAGTEAFVAGDAFIITVDITEFNYAPVTTGDIAGILFEGVKQADIDSGKIIKRTVIARNAEVQLSGLVIGAKTQAEAIEGLNALGIAVRIH